MRPFFCSPPSLFYENPPRRPHMSSLLYQSKPTTQILIPAGLSNFEKGVYYHLNLARTVSKTSVQK